MPLTAHGEQSALRSHRTPNTAASTAPLPASVTIMIRPSCGVGCESSRFDLGHREQIFFGKSEIKDSTALSTNSPTGKSLDSGESKFRSCPGRGEACSRRCQRVARMRARWQAPHSPVTLLRRAGSYIDTSKVGPGSADYDTPALPQKDNRHFRDHPLTGHIADITKPTRLTHKRHYLWAEVRCP